MIRHRHNIPDAAVPLARGQARLLQGLATGRLLLLLRLLPTVGSLGLGRDSTALRVRRLLALLTRGVLTGLGRGSLG